jgi:hypothetical protein
MSTFAEIDARIASLEREILDWRTRRNALAPLCRIPEDLLIRIFFVLQNIEFKNVSTSRNFGGKWRWYRAMSVCKHLRTTAVQTPSLWSFIDTSSQQPWIDLCVSRAGQIGLSIRALGPIPSQYFHLARSIETTTGRFETPADRMVTFLSTMTQPAPLLERVTWYHSSFLSNMAVVIGSGFLKGAHNLRFLELGSLQIDEPLEAEFSALTELVFTRVKASAVLISTFIQCAPNLERLALYQTELISSPAQLTRTAGQIANDNTNLRELYIKDRPANTWALLQTLPHPTEKLEVDIPSIYTWNSSFDENHTKVINHIMVCWRNQTTETRCPARLLAKRYCNGLHYNQLRIGSDPSDKRGVSYSGECVIRDGHPSLDYVDTLEIQLDDSGHNPFTEGEVEMGRTFLPSIRHLIIHGASYNLETGFEELLRCRYLEGIPFSTLTFKSCDDYYRSLADDLANSAYVPQVQWEDEHLRPTDR